MRNGTLLFWPAIDHLYTTIMEREHNPGDPEMPEEPTLESAETKKSRLIEMLKRSVEEFNSWREHDRESTGIDLSEADLAETNLAGANLSHANLRNVNFRGADLTRVDLIGSELRGANFWEAKVDKHTWLQIIDHLRGSITFIR